MGKFLGGEALFGGGEGGGDSGTESWYLERRGDEIRWGEGGDGMYMV